MLVMRVLALSALRDFWEGEDAAAQKPMREWFRTCELAKWKSFADVRATFSQTDLVRERYIFDIGGNKWRIIARINFRLGRVLIRWVGGHESYGRLSERDIAAL